MIKFIRTLIIYVLLTASAFGSSDVLDVAWTIYKEAEGETYHGKCAVATVIYNRVMNRRLTYQQVVKQPKQFSCWNSNPEPRVYDNIYFTQCLFLSHQLHDGTFEPLANWNMYCNPKNCSPNWYKLLVDPCIIDNHTFGYLE